MSKRVVILQPYVPGYRVEFFERLQQTLAEDGVECVIAAGIPRGAQANRGDAAKPDWMVSVQHKSVSIGARSIDLGVRPAPWKQADAVILGLEGSSLPVYHALLRAKRSKVKVGLWGHVRSYVAPGNPLDMWLETLQMRLADQVFAYTPGGAADAVRRGVPDEKVTTVMNTVDTAALEQLCQDNYSHRNHLRISSADDRARTFAFIGGLDKSKRIAFLAESLDILWREDPSIRLFVGGAGIERPLLDKAVTRGQVVDLGFLDTPHKAQLLLNSRALLMPGRIGLVAVDALVARRPILTTDWPWHAPESEYLVEGVSRLTSPDDPRAYARLVMETARQKPETVTPEYWAYPTIQQMVCRYAEGVKRMI